MGDRRYFPNLSTLQPFNPSTLQPFNPHPNPQETTMKKTTSIIILALAAAAVVTGCSKKKPQGGTDLDDGVFAPVDAGFTDAESGIPLDGTPFDLNRTAVGNSGIGPVYFGYDSSVLAPAELAKISRSASSAPSRSAPPSSTSASPPTASSRAASARRSPPSSAPAKPSGPRTAAASSPSTSRRNRQGERLAFRRGHHSHLQAPRRHILRGA